MTREAKRTLDPLCTTCKAFGYACRGVSDCANHCIEWKYDPDAILRVDHI